MLGCRNSPDPFQGDHSLPSELAPITRPPPKNAVDIFGRRLLSQHHREENSLGTLLCSCLILPVVIALTISIQSPQQ